MNNSLFACRDKKELFQHFFTRIIKIVPNYLNSKQVLQRCFLLHHQIIFKIMAIGTLSTNLSFSDILCLFLKSENKKNYKKNGVNTVLGSRWNIFWEIIWRTSSFNVKCLFLRGGHRHHKEKQGSFFPIKMSPRNNSNDAQKIVSV